MKRPNVQLSHTHHSPVLCTDLSLPERDGLHVTRLALLLCELEQRGHRVGAGREDENEGRQARGVAVRSRQVERRRLDVVGAQVVHDELLTRRGDVERSVRYWEEDTV